MNAGITGNLLLRPCARVGRGRDGLQPRPVCPDPDTSVAEKWRWPLISLLLVLVASCSTPPCRPLTVTVADKEERSWLERVPGGIRTTETGRLEEGRRTEIVRKYWVRAQDGTWHPVSLEQYRAAEIGRSLELCR